MMIIPDKFCKQGGGDTSPIFCCTPMNVGSRLIPHDLKQPILYKGRNLRDSGLKCFVYNGNLCIILSFFFVLVWVYAQHLSDIVPVPYSRPKVFLTFFSTH